MDRRILLAGLAAGAVAAPALAQQSNPNAAMPAGGSARAGQLGPADMQHIQETLQLGLVALETSKLAQQKAQNADLKQFAQFETAEQTTLSEVLHTMMDPGATAATATAPQTGTSPQTGSSPSSTPAAAAGSAARGNTAMDAKGREVVQKLQQASGAEFDRAYLLGQLEGHRNLLQVQERYLASSPQNREHVNVTKLARGQIKEHIALLEAMQQRMR
jgi:putative membrane protein